MNAEPLVMAGRPLVCIDDFVVNGEMSWFLFGRAKRANGEECKDCGRALRGASGAPTLCRDCQETADAKAQPGGIRCPHCDYPLQPWSTEAAQLYPAGDYEVCCDECDEYYTVPGDTVDAILVAIVEGEEFYDVE